VIRGDEQVEDFDYFETFAPVAKMTNVRTFLVVAAAKGWELRQMDVNNTFLHGDLDEEVYITMPLGFQASNPNRGMLVTITAQAHPTDVIHFRPSQF